MKKRNIRVCLIAPVPPPYGGISNWTILVSHYANKRNDLDISIVNTAPRWRAIDDLSIWRRIIGGGIQLLRDYTKLLFNLKVKPDVIHLTTSGQLALFRDIVILLTLKSMSIPCVFHIHFGRVPQMAKIDTFEWKMLSIATRLAHTVIALDEMTVSVINQLLPKVNVIKIPNGIDLDALPCHISPYKQRTLVYLGWVIPTKGIEELCQAWKLLNLTEWRCLIVGPGSIEYKEKLRNHYSLNNLEFIAEQSHDEAMKILASSDVLVLPSYTEGFPNVIIEAMALGKTIIASGVGAIPEMLSDECGVVVPPHDIDALVLAIREVCMSEILRKKTGKRSQKKAKEEYSMYRIIEQLMYTWDRVAGMQK